MSVVLEDGVERPTTQADLDSNAIGHDQAKVIRQERNRRLAETDWWSCSDRTMTQAEIDYRQALRDVPDQAGFPENVTWPTKP